MLKITPKLNSLKLQRFFLTVSVSQDSDSIFSGEFWLRVFHEAAIKMSARAEGSTIAEKFVTNHMHRFPHHGSLRIVAWHVSTTCQLASPNDSNPRKKKSKKETTQCLFTTYSQEGHMATSATCSSLEVSH